MYSGGYPPPTSYLFIDGASLHAEMKDFAARYFPNEEIFIEWDHVKHGHAKAFYYDAIPVQEREEHINDYNERSENKRRELDLIERHDSYHVKPSNAIRRKSGGLEQKGVDVQLAVDALTMASRGLFSRCTIITSDLDFRPLLTALVDLGIHVTLLYRDRHINNALLLASDTADPISIGHWRSWLTLDHRRRLPLVSYLPRLMNEQAQRDELLKEWNDHICGRCNLYRMSSGQYILIAEHPSKAPHDHVLDVNGLDLHCISIFAREELNVDIPN